MKILRMQALRGPNIFAHVPLLRMELDLEELTGKESKDFQAFNERLVSLLPGLQTHRCSRRRPGGFLERLDEGTFFGHIVEHVALELSSMAGISVSWGKTVYAGRPGLYEIIVEFKSEQGMTFLLRGALNLVASVLRNEPYPVEETVKEARRIARSNVLRPGMSAVLRAARDRGIPCFRLDSQPLVQIGYGKHRHLLQESVAGQPSVVGVDETLIEQLTHSGRRNREVGCAIVDLLIPPGTSGRIPVIAVTGTNGKTTVARMIAHIFEQAGKTVGLTSTDGIWIGGQEIARGDLSGFKSARTVLGDPSVDVAVLETARGGIMHSGLAYDWSDVGVVTNVQPDHIGQDGIESVEDLVHVKALVAERVRKGGTVVLNFDDERAAAMARLPRVRGGHRTIAYFSLHGMKERLAEHVRKGGKAYYLDAGRIIEEHGAERHAIVSAASLPVTANGMLDYHIANAMAAFAAVRAVGVSAQEAVDSLMSFDSITHNPGRGNIYQLGHGYVMLDYGHNPHAIQAAGQLRARRAGRRVTGIIAVPGDRADWVLAEAGKVAARSFDRVFIREDQDLRGRPSGEGAAILLRAVREEDPSKECSIILSWRQALETAIQTMQEGELIVLFYEELVPAVEMLTGLQAVPVSSLNDEGREFTRENDQEIMKKREFM